MSEYMAALLLALAILQMCDGPHCQRTEPPAFFSWGAGPGSRLDFGEAFASTVPACLLPSVRSKPGMSKQAYAQTQRQAYGVYH